MLGLLDMNDMQKLLDEVIRERDELIERLESCRMALEDSEAHCEEFKAEVRRMKEERDNAIEYGDTEHEFADSVIKDLHEARNAARFYRDLYVSQVGRTYPEEYRLPWEAEK